MVVTNLGRWVFLLGLCFFLIGFVHSNGAMYVVAIFSFLVLFGGGGLAWYSLRGLAIAREMPSSTVHAGDPLEGRIRLCETLSRWRMLEIYDTHTNRITDAVTRRHMTVMIEGWQTPSAVIAGARQTLQPAGGARCVEVHDVMRFARRGHYTLGPLTVHAYDPFGLVYLTRTIPGEHAVIVYPRPLPLAEMILGGFGGRQQTEVRPVGRAGESADFHGIRPYVQGDDLRRVHWKSTAHTGKLAIKEYEYRHSGAVQVILDLQQGVHLGEREYSTLEAAVTLSASLLNHVLAAGNQAGFLATSATITALPQESGQRQLHRALEALALARDDGTVTLAQALNSDVAQVTRRCTTVVITASVDLGIIGPLLALRGRAGSVLLVALDPHSFYKAEEEQTAHRNRLVALATTPIDLRAMTTPRKQPPSAEAHQRLVQGAAAAGLEVYPIGANLPLHQALQGIRMRI